jgi:hypothetical protein
VSLDHDDIEAIAERAAHRVVQLLQRPGPGAFELLSQRSSRHPSASKEARMNNVLRFYI